VTSTDYINALITDTLDTLDVDAARASRRGVADFEDETPTAPDATSIYDLRPQISAATQRRRSDARRRRQIRDTRENILRLREALKAGWDIGPELAYEERQLTALEARP
jgi:hypothetical protein